MSQQNRKKIVAYEEMVRRQTPRSEKPLSLLRAFLVGGLICAIGQAFRDIAVYALELDFEKAGVFTAFCLIFLAALLTGLGVYDKIGKFAGAGSIVPITGFANSIVSPAMEFKREGFVMGVGAKMFVVAGPVLVYGISASVLAGLIYYLIGCFKGV